MNSIVLLDDGDFSFEDENLKPLGGAQSAFIGLVKGLSALGCRLEVRNNCEKEYNNGLISWRRLDFKEQFISNNFIINRNTRLLSLVPKGSSVLFWLHNRGNYLLKLKNLKPLIAYYPTIVYSGKHHLFTFYLWPFFKHQIIPLGLNDCFFQLKKEVPIPKPRAIFTSNPLRSLDWLVDQWVEIRKLVPNAELHVFSGPASYGNWGQSVADRMNISIQYAKAHRDSGIFVHDPVSKAELINEIQKSRVMLYRGDVAETFCLSVAEAMELGVPCVTMDLGSMQERITSKVNGYVLKVEKDFVEKAVELLSDDQKWRLFHERLTQTPINLTWFDVAKKIMSCF